MNWRRRKSKDIRLAPSNIISEHKSKYVLQTVDLNVSIVLYKIDKIIYFNSFVPFQIVENKKLCILKNA